jgi:hypothetical protein
MRRMTERFVAFLDVLGFSDMVQAVDHDRLLQLYDNLVAFAQRAAAEGAFTLIGDGPQQRAVADLTQARVEVLVVSDSIVILSPGITGRGFVDVLRTVRDLLVNGLFLGMPLRGAITVGHVDTFVSGSGGAAPAVSVVGRGLVDAYQREAAQQWAGAVVSDQALDAFTAAQTAAALPPEDDVDAGTLVGARLLARYPVPTREGPIEGWAVSWPWGNRSKPSEETVRSAFAAHGKNPGAGAVKADATVRFLHNQRP